MGIVERKDVGGIQMLIQVVTVVEELLETPRVKALHTAQTTGRHGQQAERRQVIGSIQRKRTVNL